MAILTTIQSATSSVGEQLPAQAAAVIVDAPEVRLFVMALSLPVACYAVIASFGIYARRPRTDVSMM